MKSKLDFLLNTIESRIKKRPFHISHLLTYRCNCSCMMCKIKGKESDELNHKEICKFLEEARKIGFISYLVWGGEPFIRKDIFNILRVAYRLGYYVVVDTNGSFPDRLKKSNVKYFDLFKVSLDSHDDLHDKIRGEGVLRKAIETIKKIKNFDKKVQINTVIGNYNLEKMYGLARLAEQLNISICFFPVCYSNNYVLNSTERQIVIRNIQKFISMGLPVVDTRITFQEHPSIKKVSDCYMPRFYANLLPNGDLYLCDRFLLGNVSEQEMNELFSRERLSMLNNGYCYNCNHYWYTWYKKIYELNVFEIIKRLKYLF